MVLRCYGQGCELCGPFTVGRQETFSFIETGAHMQMLKCVCVLISVHNVYGP